MVARLPDPLWPDRQPTLAEGRLTAAWTIDHVRRTNPGGVGGSTCRAILEENHGNLPKVSELTDADIEEHKQSIESAEKAILKELNPPVSDANVKDLYPSPHFCPREAGRALSGGQDETNPHSLAKLS